MFDTPSRSLLASLALAVALVVTACPEPPTGEPDAGQIHLADAGPFVPPPDAGFDDAGVPIVVDAGPVNTSVVVSNVTPPSGPITGLNRVLVEGDGFTGACNLTPTAGAGECHVFFGDVEGDFINAVQLPKKISVRVPPCAAPGPVDVKVVTSLGIGLLEGGYTCFSPVTIESIDPDTGSTEGGDARTIHGIGLTPTMVVTIGERQVVGLVVAEDARSATLLTPPGTPGRADVVGIDAFGRSVLGLAYTYESPLRLDAVEPAVVDDVGAVVELTGSGFFDDGDEVDGDGDLLSTVGGAPAARNNLISEARLRVVVPAGLSGAQDVAVSRGPLSKVLAGALVVRPPLSGAFVVTAAVPARLDVDGGTSVTLVGEGFTAATTVTVNAAPPVPVTVVDDRTLTFLAPAGTVGAATIVLTRADASTASTSAAYVQPVDIDGIAPGFGPAAGGTVVTVTGRGFANGAAASLPTVTFGGIPATDVVVVSGTSLTATTPPGASGFVDVVVVVDGERAAAANGFRFDAPLSLLGVRPSRGGLGGGTFVTITGTGFSKGAVSIAFDGTPAFELTVVNDSTITARTPPRFISGLVDVAAQLPAPEGGTEDAVAEEVFTYFDPTSIVGGTRGGPIDGAVYITALDRIIGLPIPGLVAYIGTDSSPIAASLTNVLGQATLSGPDVYGPQTVTVVGNCYSTATFVDVNAGELTAFLYPLCQGPPGGGGGGAGPPPATIRGRVFGFAKEFFDPAALDQSGCQTGAPAKCEIAFAEVQTTARDEFGGTPLAGGDNIVFEEGGEYFIADSRTGRLAVVALAGIFDLNNDTFRLRQMGVRREVFPQFGVDLVDHDIELTIDLDAEIDVSLPDAPMRFDNTPVLLGKLPTITRVVPFLQFGGEGAFVYTQAVEGKRNHALEEMPDIPGEMLTFRAGAYTTDGRNLFTQNGTADLSNDEVFVTGDNNFDWAAMDTQGTPDPADDTFFVVGMVFVTDRPDGTRFASVIEGVVNGPTGPILQLQEAPDFTSTFATYHIGTPGMPSSEVIQDGIGDLRGGVTIQPVLGLPELLSPEEGGVLVDRTLRWKAAPGQQPTVHDMLVYDPFNLATVWEMYVDGARTKVVVPRVPTFEELVAVVPLDQRLCLTTLDPPAELAAYCQLYGAVDEFSAPPDMSAGGMFWQHEAIFVPDLDNNNWSFLQIGSRGRRAWTTDVHSFVHGLD
jgi:hypothetical protein